MRSRSEVAVTRALVKHMAERGFLLDHIEDPWGELEGYDCDVATADDVIRFCREVDFDIYTVRFTHVDDPKRTYWLTLIPWNGVDVLSDWGVPLSDSRGWDDALCAFNPDEVTV